MRIQRITRTRRVWQLGAVALATTLAVSVAGVLAAGYNPHAYVYGGASPAVARAIQAAGYGQRVTGSAKTAVSSRHTVARYDPHAYVYGGASPWVAQAIQDAGYGRTTSETVLLAARSVAAYNPHAYVYGGASAAVARAIQEAGYGK